MQKTQNFLSMSADHRTRSTHLSREKPIVLKKKKTILDAFWSWLDEQKPRKGSRFETAVKYAQNRKYTLMTYLEDGHCSFSNNLSENAIRPFTVGRKKTGCSAQLQKVPLPVHWSTQWSRWQRPMSLTFINT